MKKIKLFCLPHAGGFSMQYNKWKGCINDAIEVIPIELKGRGKRMSEGFYNNFDDAINDIYIQINEEIDDSKFAIFGHSMGAILAYELAYKIIKMKNQTPTKLFLSGNHPPHVIKSKKAPYLLSDRDFMSKIVSYGGIAAEVLQEESLVEMLIPIFKADFKILNEYEYVKKGFKLDCDIIALTGKDDVSVNINYLNQWGEHTNKNFYIYEFHGGHFYINDNLDKIINIINEKILGD